MAKLRRRRACEICQAMIDNPGHYLPTHLVHPVTRTGTQGVQTAVQNGIVTITE
jgi:hypothetical protein